MFKTLPNGVEIYFSWPSRTARIVPNKSVKNGIVTRDNALVAHVTLFGFIATFLREPSPTIGVAMGLLGVALFVERGKYLSRLPKLSLELASDTQDERSIGSANSVQITAAEVDEAYIADRIPFDGIFLTAVGAFMTAGSSYLLFTSTEVPLVFSLPLTAAAVAITYVGFRILVVKWRLRQRGGRHRRREKY